MNTTHREDVKGDFNACKELFLLAEIHRNEKLSVEDSKKPERPAKGFSESKSRMKKGNGSKKSSSSNTSQSGNFLCKFCSKNGYRGGREIGGNCGPISFHPASLAGPRVHYPSASCHVNWCSNLKADDNDQTVNTSMNIYLNTVMQRVSDCRIKCC